MARLQRSSNPVPARGRTRASSNASIQSSSAPPVRRSTRQQSKEVASPAKSSSKISPKKQKQTRPTTVDSGDTEDLPNLGKTRNTRARGLANAQDLTPVAEDPNAEEAEDELDEDEEHDPLHNRSGLSGSTAVTSHSATQLSELREHSNELASMLIELYNASNAIFLTLVPDDVSKSTVEYIIKELQKPDSIVAINLRRRARTQDEFPFGTDYFIRRDLVLRALFDTDPPNVPSNHRPDEILQKHNLAKLARKLIPLNKESEVSKADLQMVDETFPQPFLSAFRDPRAAQRDEVGVSNLERETFSLGLDIRTQLLLMILREQSSMNNFDPDDVLTQIFFDGDARLQTMKGWNVLWPNQSPENLPRSLATLWKNRYNDIRRCFTVDGDNTVDFDELEQSFTLNEFKLRVSKWIKARNAEVDVHIAQKGGPEAISSRLETRRLKKTAGRSTLEGRFNFVRGDSAAIARVAASKAAREHRKSLGMAKADQAHRAEDIDEGGPIEFEDDEINNHALTKQNQMKQQQHNELASSPARTRGRGRPPKGVSKPSLLDRQSDAERVSPISDDGARARNLDQRSTNVIPVDSSRSVRGQDQPTVTQDNGYGDDGDFEVNRTTPSKPADRRKSKPAQTGTANKKRTAPQDVPEPIPKRVRRAIAANEDDADYRAENNQQDDDRDDVGAEEEEEEEDIPASDYREISAQAKLATQRLAAQKRVTQTRTPWSAAEEDVFINLIREWGISWSRIKEKDEGQHLILRDQVGLKDKARNIKVNYLLTGVPLPRNFGKVALDKKARAKLEAHGIQYEGA